MKSFRSIASFTVALAALATGVTASAAIDYTTNIARNTNGATAIMGYNSADDGTLGTAYRNTSSGGAYLSINDGIMGSLSDTWLLDKDGAANGFYDYCGVLWAAPQSNVAAVRITHNLNTDGGWFDYPGLAGSTDFDTESDNGNVQRNISIAPRIQYTTDGGTSWLDVTPVTNNYPSVIGGTSAVPPAVNSTASGLITFEFTALSNINGIRVFGDGADVNNASGSNQAGFIAIREFESYQQSVPEPTSLGLIALASMALLRRRHAAA